LNVGYFDLIHTREYFDVFLKHFNSAYGKQAVSASNTTITMLEGTDPQEWNRFLKYHAVRSRKSGEEKEPHYEKLIKRYYGIDQGIARNSSSTSNHIKTLISDETHIKNLYESLKRDFRMGTRGLRLVPLEEFSHSIRAHEEVLIRLAGYRMESISPAAIPQEPLDGLELLFRQLHIVPPKSQAAETPGEGPKLVAVSKTLHFLLPDLVMPVDRAKVLRFFGKKGDVPSDQGKQFAWFRQVFDNYVELTVHLGLTSGNGDGNWWNVSVPKRIDNAIIGFWDLFSDENLERIICGNIGTLLTFLRIT
jgi:hypothetical protein